MSDKDLKSTLARLNADYAAQLPRTVEQMEELWRHIVALGSPAARLQELAQMAHRIAGSGATFGIPAAGRAARELELFLDRLDKSGSAPGPQEQQTVSALLAELRQSVLQQ